MVLNCGARGARLSLKTRVEEFYAKKSTIYAHFMAAFSFSLLHFIILFVLLLHANASNPLG